MKKMFLGIVGVAAMVSVNASCSSGSLCPFSTSRAASCGVAMQTPEQAVIVDSMKKVSDWMLDNTKEVGSKNSSPRNWTRGAWFTGIYAFYNLTKDPRAFDALMNLEKSTQWKVGPKPLFGDDQAIAQTYLDIYRTIDRDPKIIDDIKTVIDGMMANPVDLPMDNHSKVLAKGEWSWCDGLFMAPPVWVKLAKITGEQKYLDFMDKKWDKTYHFLFDKEANLYYRDASYFKKREKNGQKVFWSRGNGWVMGGLCLMLKDMPKDYPQRAKYEDLFRRMAAATLKCQQADGSWHASLLDPASYPSPETSGTGFYCYAYAFGINNGILCKETYQPAVDRAWAMLNRCIHPDGRLGYAQKIGADPQHVSPMDAEVYAVGAYLLAGCEMYKMAGGCHK